MQRSGIDIGIGRGEKKYIGASLNFIISAIVRISEYKVIQTDRKDSVTKKNLNCNLNGTAVKAVFEASELKVSISLNCRMKQQ